MADQHQRKSREKADDASARQKNHVTRKHLTEAINFLFYVSRLRLLLLGYEFPLISQSARSCTGVE
jgi:hypothetical protein